VEEFVEIAHPEEQQEIGVLRLGRVVLAHGGGVMGFCGHA
jgi:hypothetical protein